MKYVQPRPPSGVYYYKRRVPQIVVDDKHLFTTAFGGRTPYVTSLRTTDETEAFARASIENKRFEEKIATANKGRSVHTVAALTSRPVTAEDIPKIARHVRDGIVSEWAGYIRAVRRKLPQAAEHLDWQIEKEIEAAEKHAASHGASLHAVETKSELKEARSINAIFGFNVDEDSPEFGAILSAVMDGTKESKSAVQDMLEGSALPQQTRSTLIRDHGENKKLVGKPILISEAWDFQMKIEDFPIKTFRKKDRSIRTFVTLIGDKPIHEIERRDIVAFAEHVASRNVGNTDKPLSPATIKAEINPISSVIGFAIEREWIVGPNPAINIKVDKFARKTNQVHTPPKRRFFNDELKELFAHPVFSGCKSLVRPYHPGSVLIDDARYWAPVTALYTGARAAELGGLRPVDIKFTPVPHIVIAPNKYRGVKSKKERLVPLLDALLNLGFKEYVERITAEKQNRLFPDWTAKKVVLNGKTEWNWSNGNIIRAFNRKILGDLFPVQSNYSRSPISFHSFRGSAKKLLYSTGKYAPANNVIGHALEELEERYLGQYDIKELYQEFHTLDYDGLNIKSRR